MGQSVRIADNLVMEARLVGEIEDRSIAGQIEFWAHLGQALEPLLQGNQVLALRRAGRVKPLSACLDSVDTEEGRRRVKDYLERLPFPHYEPAPDRPGMLVRIEADGTRSVGRFINRQFTPAEIPELDHRPVIVAIAGPNGAGKSTFFHTHIAFAGLRFIEPDALASELGADAYTAAKMADALRRSLMCTGESFAFETVFSDPARDKLTFLKEAVVAGYTVVMCFIGLANPGLSETRVAMRVSQGGHDVPTEKIHSRFPRTMANLKAAICELPIVYVFDNSDMSTAFRKISVFRRGQQIYGNVPLPEWFDISLR